MTNNNILVAGANGFIGKYVIQELVKRLTEPVAQERVITLGRSESNGVRVDLLRSVPEIKSDVSMVVNLVGSCFGSDPRGVNVTTLRNLLSALEGKSVKEMVYLSSVEIYGRKEGENWSEADIIDPCTPLGYAKEAAEKTVMEWCESRGVTCTILRLPLVVGTGMKGPLSDMIKRIYRGSYHHIAGNEARMSVVHATDVAKAVIDLAEKGGVYNLTDGVNPTVHDLADAFSRRLKDKKIMTLSVKRANRWALVNDFIPGAWMDRAELKRMTTSLTFSSEKAIEALGYRPNSVTDYLVNHDYDNDPF